MCRSKCDKLAVLVGSNPLPNYLAAVVLRPREIVLLHSPETTKPRDRLRQALESRYSALKVTSVAIADATDAREIAEAVRGLKVDHLHYSGGTKPMAAHARRVCQIEEGQASYLDERKGLLRFDDGCEIRLEDCDLGLTLDVVLKLHGIKRRSSPPSTSEGPTGGDVDAVRMAILANPERAKSLYHQLRPQGRRKNLTQAKEQPCRPGIPLSISIIPEGDWNKARYEVWDDFLAGGWLERWTAGRIRFSLGESSLQVEVNVRCERNEPTKNDFEIDVALVRGHRLYVVSCTTAPEKALCKSKLFEVAMRSRQMGGDLARCALVCLLDKGSQGDDYVEKLRADIADLWDAPSVPAVFGLADLREWAGTSGESDTGTLKRWLDS